MVSIKRRIIPQISKRLDSLGLHSMDLVKSDMLRIILSVAVDAPLFTTHWDFYTPRRVVVCDEHRKHTWIYSLVFSCHIRFIFPNIWKWKWYLLHALQNTNENAARVVLHVSVWVSSFVWLQCWNMRSISCGEKSGQYLSMRLETWTRICWLLGTIRSLSISI